MYPVTIDLVVVSWITYISYILNEQSVDPLLAYLEQNLQTLYERLESAIFPHILQHIWQAAVTCFDETILSGVSITH